MNGTAMEALAEEWARKVVAKGMPARSLPVDEQAEAYEDLSTAYAILADLAHHAGDTERSVALSEMAEQTDWHARQLRPQDPWADR